jgi:hypothetical protein
MTYNTISQNNDDHFYTAVCAYVRGEGNGIVPGTVGEEQAEIAKRLLRDSPAILDGKDRLLAEIAAIHYRESGAEARVTAFAKMDREYDEKLFADLRAYVWGQPHNIRSGSIGEGYAKHAKDLAAKDPTILDDQPRLLAVLRGFESEPEPLEPATWWRIHRGRVNRDCISDAEYKRRMEERRAAAEIIDPTTAELKWWYGETLDPYGDGLPLLPFEEQTGREYFARAPGSDIWVSVDDLPDTTRDAIWKRFENTKGAILRIGFDVAGQLRMSGLPPV